MNLDFSRILRASISFALVALAANASAQDRDSRDRGRVDFRWDKSLPNGSHVTVHDINGDISITPSTNGRVEIVGIRHGSDRYADDLKAQVVETRDGIVVCVVWRDSDSECDDRGYHSHGEGGDHWNHGSMDLELRVPSDVQVSANSVSGDIGIVGARGDVRANSVSGDVKLDRLRASSVSAHSVSGDIEVHVEELTGRGDLSFKTVSGDVTVELPRGLDADVSLSTVSGSLDSDFQMTLNGRVSRRRIEARVGQGGRGLDVTTVSGDVRLKMSRS
jgi:putative adhesin